MHDDHDSRATILADHTILFTNVVGVTVLLGQEHYDVGDHDQKGMTPIGARIEWPVAVRMSPVGAKLLAKQLGEFVSMYETRFGPIPLDLMGAQPAQEGNVTYLRGAPTPSDPPATEAPEPPYTGSLPFQNQPDQTAQDQPVPPAQVPRSSWLDYLRGPAAQNAAGDHLSVLRGAQPQPEPDQEDPQSRRQTSDAEAPPEPEQSPTSPSTPPTA